MIEFRTVYGFNRKGRPFTDYITVCNMDEAKGLNLGSHYGSDKLTAKFAPYISEVERCASGKINLSINKWKTMMRDMRMRTMSEMTHTRVRI